MNSIDIANGIIFKKLKVSKDTFDERIICQKKIYLLQSLGTDLGYSYNWYVRGPYSPALANYIYSNIELLESIDFAKYRISDEAENNIEIVNDLESSKSMDLKVSSWYELLASMLYIEKNKGSWKVEAGKTALFSELKKNKPQYNEEQCEKAYAVLKDKGFAFLET